MSQDLNSVALTGRLVRDAEIRYTNSGTAITTFSIASNRSVKKGDKWEEEGQFFDIKLLGKSGEAIHKYLTKGSPVAISGKLMQDRWEKDGKWNSKVYVLADYTKMLAPKPSGDAKPQGGYGGDHSNGGYGYQQGRDGGGYRRDEDYSPSDFPEDIPF